MHDFWHFARRMLRYRAMVVLALGMAAISALSLGAGLVGVYPILKAMLGEHQSLADIVTELNARPPLAGAIPQAWIDALPTGTFTAVVWIFAILGGLTVFGGVTNFLHAFLSLTVIQRTIANVRRDAFHRVIRLPLRDIVAGGTADKVSRIVHDAATLEAGLNALLSKGAAQVAKGIACFAAAIVVLWWLALSALIVGPPLYIIIRRLGKRIRRASRSALASQAGLYAEASQALQGLRVVKVHTTERYEAGRFHRTNKEVMRQMFRVRTARALSSPVVEVLSLFALGFLSILAVKAIMDGRLDSASFLLCIGALFAAGASVKPLSGLLNDIQASAGAAQRIRELLSLAPEPGHDPKLPRLARHARSIEFKGVTLTYPGAAQPALRDIDLTVRFGERLAIVGPNGSGKTTLLSLVPRLFDPDAGKGAVLIDGRDIRECSVRSLRDQIGVVTQETVLFRGTIRSNLAYGADNATDARVREAARRARAAEFIEAIPGGYDALVGEQGLTLSGGQRQRLAIARAILREPAILILDEATSMIDADSEAHIAEALAEFSSGRTCLIVAHRLSTVKNADRIVVMDGGRVVDQGTHADLLARCPTYRLIAQNQLLGEG